MSPCPASRSVARRFAGLIQRILNLRIINLEGEKSIDSRGGNPMARSEKDRALLFLTHASVMEYVRADAFYFVRPLLRRAFRLVLQGVWGYEAYGFTLTFLSTGCRSAFHCQDFRDILRAFFCCPTRNGWHYGCRTGASSYAVYNLSHQGTDCLVSGFRPTEVMKAVMPRQGS